MENQCIKCRDLTDLTPAQIHVYHDLHTVIDDNKPRVILLDAPSGTGKTRIISTLAEKYRDRVSYAVFHRAYASEVNAETHDTYMHEIFNLTLEERRSFTLDYLINIEVLGYLLIVAQKYNTWSTRAIIVDDCSVIDPLMVVALYLVSLMNKITLIFSGNRRQLGYIEKTQKHSRNYKDNDLKRIYLDWKGWDGRSNFDVLDLISDPEITQEFTRTLIENHRSSDQGFLEKVQCFGNAVARYKITERAPFHFNLRYLLYTLFKEKFDPTLEDSSDNLFMAEFHKVITKKMEEMRAVNDTKYRVAPFDGVPFNTNPTNKFLPGLILRPGKKIIYCSKEGVQEFVELEHMECDKETGDLTKLWVKFENGNSLCINRYDLNFYQILPANRKWLMEHMEHSHISPNIRNFPLKQYSMTYYAVLGRTIIYPVELSIERNFADPNKDFSNATAVYVGLCSLTSESNIKKIHAEDNLLYSFWLTDDMSAMDNQEYYYRCNEYNGRCNGISYPEVYTIREFENDTPVFKKIKRSVYETNMRNEDMIADSPLMEITKFVRDNTAAVRDFITDIENSGLDDAMTALSKAYHAWESRIMNEL